MIDYQIEIMDATEEQFLTFCKFSSFDSKDLAESMEKNEVKLLHAVIKSDGLPDFFTVGIAVKESEDIFKKESIQSFLEYFMVLQTDDRYRYSKHEVTGDLIEEVLNDLERALSLPDGLWKKYYHYDLELLRSNWLGNFADYRLDGDEILNHWGKWLNNAPRLFWIHHYTKEAFIQFEYWSEENCKIRDEWAAQEKKAYKERVKAQKKKRAKINKEFKQKQKGEI